MRRGRSVSRRRFLEAGMAMSGSLAASHALSAARLPWQAPAIVRSEAMRPALPQAKLHNLEGETLCSVELPLET